MRTIGQLVAESLQLYRRYPWKALLVGVPPAVLDVVAAELARPASFWFAVVGGAVLLTLSYVGATLLVATVRPPGGVIARAFGVGALVFLPFPFLATALILPGLAWLALVGLAVPAIVIEQLGLRAGLARAVRLARADYVHALGSLAALAILYFLTRFMLAVLLRGQSDQTERVAAFLADVVVAPVLFLGAALLYFDQAARVVDSRPSRGNRRRDADLRDALDADRAGDPDAPVEPRPPA